MSCMYYERITNMSIKIDSNVKLPSSSYGIGIGKYPWHEMNSGDSFFIAEAKTRPATPLFKTQSRVCVENGVKGIRVWKV